MGAGASKQQIGERVKAAKRKLEESEKAEEEQFERLSKLSPETLSNMVDSIVKALSSCSPFPESILLLAFRADAERVKKALTACTQKVLTAPIQKGQYQWFKQYVFPSSVWFKKMKSGEYLYSEMMKITNLKQKKIVENMDAVYDHLKSHSKWSDIMSIQNQSAITRQDEEAVGLLQEPGIRDILELKDSDDDNDDIDNLKHFIDGNLAISTLMTTAKTIDSEFQKEMGTILSRHGEFKPGPMKKVERALSKMENDYMDEAYPKAAKLLDIVRCSVSYNTAGQFLDGYNAFINHLESGVSSLQLARVKNGFIDSDDGGYRDIKVNVVYHSTLNPQLKMICEVQFILNQYLYEKKRVHKLYSIAREETYFDMVALGEDELENQQRMKAMKFEEILNVRDEVQCTERNFGKCSIDSDLGLLGMHPDAEQHDDFLCIDISTKQIVFRHKASGRYTHHWITINEQKYLFLQTAPNNLSMFRVSDDHQFEEDESMKITLDDDDVINFCEFDQQFNHIFIVKNYSILEKRAVKDSGAVLMSFELENRIGNSVSKLMSLSNDGKFCVIGAAGNTMAGGAKSNFFYLVSLETQDQFKLNSVNLTSTYAPCFIDGDSHFVAVGGHDGEGVEIWDIIRKKMVHHIDECREDNSWVTCSYSANGILAVGYCTIVQGHQGTQCIPRLQLYDVTTWAKIYKRDFKMTLRYLFLTPDNKYLAAGGNGFGSEKSLILKIQ